MAKTHLPLIRTLVQSVLRFGDHLLWCEVVVRDRHDYEVHVVPQWDMSMAIVEPFGRALDALQRHAELSWLLRQSGWDPALVDDSTRRGFAAA